MSKAWRKAVRQEFKQRKPSRGAFAVRCTATGQTWVGSSPNVDAAQNLIWSTLRMAASRETAMQAQWNEFGESSFAFEVLELLPDDLAALNVRDELESAKRRWASELGATTLL